MAGWTAFNCFHHGEIKIESIVANSLLVHLTYFLFLNDVVGEHLGRVEELYGRLVLENVSLSWRQSVENLVLDLLQLFLVVSAGDDQCLSLSLKSRPDHTHPSRQNVSFPSRFNSKQARSVGARLTLGGGVEGGGKTLLPENICMENEQNVLLELCSVASRSVKKITRKFS